MSAKKVLTLVVCMVLVAALSVAGTLAYLTSQDSAVNEFSMGSVAIKLEESKVNRLGVADGSKTDKNAYYLLPGHDYVKDPTVTVLKPSSDCYVRMMVTVTLDNVAGVEGMDINKIFTGYDEKKWDRVDYKVVNNTITYEYRYVEKNNGIVNAEAGEVKLPALFTGISVPKEWTNDDLAKLSGLKIDVVAHAIQADGFGNADAAWIAFGNQHK